MKRIKGLCSIGAMIMSLVEWPFLKVEGIENMPTTSAIYAVKHQKMRDIWCMGAALYRYRSAAAYYPMKESLPEWMTLFGGITIYRPEDIKQLLRKEQNLEQRALLRRSLERKTKTAFATLSEILSNSHRDASIVICPEGHRYNGVGPLHRNGMNMLLVAQRDDYHVPVVPVGTEYAGKKSYLRIGKPRTYTQFTETDAQAMRQELAALSHCSVLEEKVTSEQTAPIRVS
jgi:1-acyl-sn-glycerol-3-phosphate acyltransferase